LFGLDISSSAVKMVELDGQRGKDGYRVERYAIVVLPKDAVSDGNIANLDGVVDCRQARLETAWGRLRAMSRWPCRVPLSLPRKSLFPPACGMTSLKSQVEIGGQPVHPVSRSTKSISTTK
jgi:type IV pilus assembly protein PilM